MCGLFGYLGQVALAKAEVASLKNFSVRRGQDSSGVLVVENTKLRITRADFSVQELWREKLFHRPSFVAGHSRLITNGHNDNQPVVRDDIIVLHNGIILNSLKLWRSIGLTPGLEIDTEVIAALVRFYVDAGRSLLEACEKALSQIVGEANCIVMDSRSGEIAVMSNNGSLYTGDMRGGVAISSEHFPLAKNKSTNIVQIYGAKSIGSVEVCGEIEERNLRRPRANLVPNVSSSRTFFDMPKMPQRNLRRCSQCVLPDTMPFIQFDDKGVCNYCHNYRPQSQEIRIDELREHLDSEHGVAGRVLFPFSGGRDSSYGLHVATQMMGVSPIAYTYDWGMVTDLGRRNMSLMCAKLGVEHIIVAANISKKRANIRRNVSAWLKRPHLGMVNLFTAGDKHFFEHVNAIQKQTQIMANLWSFNPLETTHFKTGFLGIPPDFTGSTVYRTGFSPQVVYQFRRAVEFAKNPAYLNRSLWDTFSGEYFRSIRKKRRYLQLFDYMPWKEEIVNNTIEDYGWEKADDTSTTWRIGDGTAAFYNYIYFAYAGFTEHDTLRSNQVREGHISRDLALALVQEENEPRYQSIKWYLDAIGLDFGDTLNAIHQGTRSFVPDSLI